MKLWLNREEVAQKDDPSSWLFTVASNQAFNYLKKMSNSQRYIDYVKRESHQQVSQPEAEQHLTLKEKQAAYHHALDRLPQQRRIIFRMSREQLLTHKEIAEKLQISPFTVKNQLIAALGFLRKHLHRNDALFLIGLHVLRNIIF
jgi:RNA polymerase sigma-70 factor (ECF subfamily)